MELTATEWNTVEDKERFISKFKKFVESGFPESAFDEKFYNRMSMMRGHIAHYNREGFYQAQFDTSARRAEFLDQWTTGRINGDPSCTWSDAETIISIWLRDRPEYEAKERMQHDAIVEDIERRELARLTAKYERR